VLAIAPSFMSSPRVTVIVATYNWSTVLPYAIRSVLAQTLTDIELLIVGDACTDDSEQVVAGFTDPRVRWINLAVRHGHQTGPNNRGLAEARGEFIAYLGHDDLWLPHHLECTVEALTETGAARACAMVARLLPGDPAPLPVFPGGGTPPSGTVHRRSLIETAGGWRDHRDLYLSPENDLWQRSEAAGLKTVFVQRLTALKFPASKRKDVYRLRPCHEQAAWLSRIERELALEVTLLSQMMTSGAVARVMPARKLVVVMLREIAERLRGQPDASGRRWSVFNRKGGAVMQAQKYKGL
jgi:hypothetical protein